MKKQKIVFNYDALRSMDMVCCSGRSPFAMVTRIVTSGWRYMFNHGIAVHTAMIVELDGQKLIAEMQPKGLEIHSLQKYSKIGGRRWVIGLRRHSAYDDEQARKDAQAKIMLDLRRRLEYDYKGLFEFVCDRVKDNPKRAYCSEYYYQVSQDRIGSYPKGFAEKVSPRDLQTCAGFFPVADWAVSPSGISGG